jgi:hypothetical protein
MAVLFEDCESQGEASDISEAMPLSFFSKEGRALRVWKHPLCLFERSRVILEPLLMAGWPPRPPRKSAHIKACSFWTFGIANEQYAKATKYHLRDASPIVAAGIQE